jgi:UDP-glucose:(heptosyl)LPS alpha-1,3-glucosyltransferase
MEPHIVDPFYVGSLWRDLGFARAVCREVGRARLALVQSHERLLCCDIFRAGDGVHAVWLEERMRAMSSLKRLGVHINPHHRYILSIERRLFKSPWLSAVICNSKMVRDEIRERFSFPEEKLHVIYNAVDSESFSPELRTHRQAVLDRHRIPSDATVYLLVGSGFERKGVATAIEALGELPPPAHLIVVGRDRHLRHYARLARELRLSGRVTLAGPQIDPRPYFGAADVFVLPTIYDPFPNAALEAMACGLPVITSTKSGAAELVLEHDCGFVCPSADVAGLAAHMRVLLDPVQRERFGEHARRAVLPLTAASMTLQLVLLYKELLAASVTRRHAGRTAGAATTRPPAAAPVDSPSTPGASTGSQNAPVPEATHPETQSPPTEGATSGDPPTLAVEDKVDNVDKVDDPASLEASRPASPPERDGG